MFNRFLSERRSGKIIIFLIFLTAFTTGFVTVIHLKKIKYARYDGVLCYAAMNIHRKSMLLSVHLKYILDDGKGVIIMRGRLSDNDTDIGIVSRDIEFDYQRKASLVTAQVKSIRKMAQDTANDTLLAPLLPEIWSDKGNQGIFYIYPQYPNGYVFGRNFLPSFYCSNIK
ncbi:hypothetical protein [Enterobacter sp. NFIX58]|uniref:hypothetical protein n=1 Tax=Enterobacter sp. NFIX58 TaxID=1566251 RepID=UPI0008D1C131|nr:hypothetical protein [Enterobacter sp. NFIX58]SEO96402.1 FidL-like putative membrane protein [Enterobacter sp. NFIX58]